MPYWAGGFAVGAAPPVPVKKFKKNTQSHKKSVEKVLTLLEYIVDNTDPNLLKYDNHMIRANLKGAKMEVCLCLHWPSTRTSRRFLNM